MAFGRSVVATQIGCEGLATQDGASILIANNADEFTDAVLGLLRDRARREHIAHEARALAKARYDWNVVLSKAYDGIF